MTRSKRAMTKVLSEIWWPFGTRMLGGALNPKEVCTDEGHCLNVMRGAVFPKFEGCCPSEIQRFGANRTSRHWKGVRTDEGNCFTEFGIGGKHFGVLILSAEGGSHCRRVLLY